jgi:hypothetical protein
VAGGCPILELVARVNFAIFSESDYYLTDVGLGVAKQAVVIYKIKVD